MAQKEVNVSRAHELPMPPLPATWLPFWKEVIAARGNTIAAWPAAAFEADVIRRRVLLRERLIVNSPEHIRRVLIENVGNYRRSKLFARIVEPVIGAGGMMLAEGDEWRHQRRATSSFYAPSNTPALAGMIMRHTARMLERWGQIENGDTLDISKEMARITLGVGAELIFAQDDAEGLDDIAQSVAEYDARVRPTLGDLLGLPNWISRHRFTHVRRLARRVQAPIARLVAQRTNSAEGGDLMSAIAAPREAGQVCDERSITDQAMTLLLGGHIPTCAALTWVFYLLARHPHERERFEAELDEVLGGRLPDHADIPKLSFTKQAIEEALRLYPPVHIIPRVALDADRLGEHSVPKGAMIVISPWLLHRNPRLWDHPSRFMPERFSEANAASRSRYTYLPFGLGPRTCIGGHLAMTEMLLVVASVGQSWRLDVANDDTVEPVALVSLRPRNGLKLRFTRRLR